MAYCFWSVGVWLQKAQKMVNFNFCHPLKTFCKQFGSRFAGPYLDLKLFDTLNVFPKEFFEKVRFEKN